MKNLKIYKRITSGVLSLISLGSVVAFSSCSKNIGGNTIYISAPKQTYEEYLDEDSNLSRFKDLRQENKDKKKYEYVLDTRDFGKELLYVNKDRNYTSDLIKDITEENTIAKTTRFFYDFASYIIPDCYKWTSNKFNGNLCEYNIKVKEFRSNQGRRYLLFETNVEFKREPNYPTPLILFEGQEKIKKGDYINCKRLYREDYISGATPNKALTFVAFSQTGMGSDCDNVKNYHIETNQEEFTNNLLMTLEDSNLINDSVTFDDYNELNKYIDTLFNENKLVK